MRSPGSRAICRRQSGHSGPTARGDHVGPRSPRGRPGKMTLPVGAEVGVRRPRIGPLRVVATRGPTAHPPWQEGHIVRRFQYKKVTFCAQDAQKVTFNPSTVRTGCPSDHIRAREVPLLPREWSPGAPVAARSGENASLLPALVSLVAAAAWDFRVGPRGNCARAAAPRRRRPRRRPSRRCTATTSAPRPARPATWWPCAAPG